MSRTVLIVGSSVGGVRTAQALRSAGWDDRIVLLGEEPELPYDKPPLSKAWLAGTVERTGISLLDEARAGASGIELRLGRRAMALDVAGRAVLLEGGDRACYDHLVIATGAGARPSPWRSPKGVHVLRTLADAEALRADLLAGGPVVVIGAGFIGSEVAATCRALGLDVTIVDPLEVPAARLLGDAVGGLLTGLHRRHGVTTRFGVGVEAIDGSGRELTVRLSDGGALPASVVVVGIGARPNDGWLAASGLSLDDGVVCDEHGRTSAPGVWAVGDVARWFRPRHRAHARIEHWTSAVEQAACVAHNITHPDDLRGCSPVEYVWSDQHDWKIQIVGTPGGALRHDLVGDPSGRFCALYTHDGEHVSGAVTVNWPKALVLCRRMPFGELRSDCAVEQLSGLPASGAGGQQKPRRGTPLGAAQ